MDSPKLVQAVIVLSLAGLFSGCGSSGTAPVMPLAIVTSSPLSSGEASIAYNANLTANGGVAPYAWTMTSGTLPPGLNFSSSGVLSGTPTAPGTYTFSVSVTDSQRSPSTANSNLSLTIVPALQITTTSLSNSSVGLAYSATLGASGGFPAYTWSITQGNLPSGLGLNATSGVISGMPTGAGTSTFTVKVTDNGTPAASTTANLSIAITPPPPKNAALYIDQVGGGGNPPGPMWDQTGLRIQADGSLTILPSSPEFAINGTDFAASPTLPLIFLIPHGGGLESLLVNSDYSLSLYSSSPLPFQSISFHPSVDPTGSNLYLPGPLVSGGTTGIYIFPGNGSLQSLGTIALPNLNNSSLMVFTPDGKLAFIQTCTANSNQGSIASYSRAADGTLTATATYNLANTCVFPMAVSSDGKYLATANYAGGPPGGVEVYSIASDGTLTSVLPQPFTVTLGPGATEFAAVTDMIWDPSSAFLAVAVIGTQHTYDGGVGVLSFSGSSLSQTLDPTGGGTLLIQRAGSLIYGMQACHQVGCAGPFGILGFDFQNGQLIPLPGSPFPYGNGSDMVIY
jgi:hypothetical protein